MEQISLVDFTVGTIIGLIILAILYGIGIWISNK